MDFAGIEAHHKVPVVTGNHASDGYAKVHHRARLVLEAAIDALHMADSIRTGWQKN